METKVTQFDHKGTDLIKIICSSMGENPYYFTIVVITSKHLFNTISLMKSLQPSYYDELVKTIREEKLDKK